MLGGSIPRGAQPCHDHILVCYPKYKKYAETCHDHTLVCFSNCKKYAKPYHHHLLVRYLKSIKSADADLHEDKQANCKQLSCSRFCEGRQIYCHRLVPAVGMHATVQGKKLPGANITNRLTRQQPFLQTVRTGISPFLP